MADFIIYGCTVYTGRLVAEYLKSLNLNFVVAGRAEGKVADFAARLDVPYRVFNLSDPKFIDKSLKGVSPLLDCAAPLENTSSPLMNKPEFINPICCRARQLLSSR